MPISISKLPRNARVGVPGELLPINLKKKLLLFDYLAVNHLEETMEMSWNIKKQEQLAEYHTVADDLEFLIDEGLVLDPGSVFDHMPLPEDIKNDASVFDEWATLAFAYKDHTDASKELKKTAEMVNSRPGNPSEAVMKNYRDFAIHATYMKTAFFQISAIVSAKQLRKVHHIQASAILPDRLITPVSIKKEPNLESPDTDLVEIVLNRIPMPDDMTPWERIIEFRNDPDTRGFLQGLRLWMTDMASQSLSPAEASEKLEWLIFQRERHLKAHHMSVNSRSFGALFVKSIEVAEDLAKFRWGKVANGLASLVDRKASLIKYEVEAPGQEIHYLMKTEKEFGD